MRDPAERNIGTRLRAARQRLAWSREALAYRSGLSWSAIEQIESGRRSNVTLNTLSALSAALGVSIDYLVEGSVAPSRQLRHLALFYGSDDEFLAMACPYLLEGIEREEVLLAVTSEDKIVLLKGALGEQADRVQFAEASIWYEGPAAAMRAYRTFIKDGLKNGASWVRIVAEALPWSHSDEGRRLLNRWEAVFDLAFGSAPATVLCANDVRIGEERFLAAMKETHAELLEGDEISENPSYRDPGMFLIESMP
jgi:transcriptional regulator with XRE-family HTH domain